MSTKISTKMGYVRTDGWRGYSRPLFAVAGANDTGNFDDSPCPSGVRKKEISEFTKVLRQNKIPYVTKWANSTNVFCVKQFVIVAEEHHAKAYELAEQHEKVTRLFYSCEVMN